MCVLCINQLIYFLVTRTMNEKLILPAQKKIKFMFVVCLTVFNATFNNCKLQLKKIYD